MLEVKALSFSLSIQGNPLTVFQERFAAVGSSRAAGSFQKFHRPLEFERGTPCCPRLNFLGAHSSRFHPKRRRPHSPTLTLPCLLTSSDADRKGFPFAGPVLLDLRHVKSCGSVLVCGTLRCKKLVFLLLLLLLTFLLFSLATRKKSVDNGS
jgi:hypothetical protein